MNSAQYKQIQESLNFKIKLWRNLAILALDACLIYVASIWIDSGLLGLVASWFILGLVALHGFTIVHEGAHGTLAQNRLLNWLVAHIGGVFALMPPTAYRNGHIEHHIWVGNTDRDPVLKVLHRVCRTPGLVQAGLRFCWRTWVPLLAFVQLATLWTFPLRHIARDTRDGAKFVSEIISILVVVAGWGVLAYFYAAYVRWSVVMPSLVVYLILTELISFPHHNDIPTLAGKERLPIWKQFVVTRTCYFPRPISTLLCMNFNLHTEHHLFPYLPWTELPAARVALLEALGDAYNDSQGFAWDIENRRKDAVTAIVGERPTSSFPKPEKMAS